LNKKTELPITAPKGQLNSAQRQRLGSLKPSVIMRPERATKKAKHMAIEKNIVKQQFRVTTKMNSHNKENLSMKASP